jgi:energy-coupling factor transporter ATP-binding protein EcfA2
MIALLRLSNFRAFESLTVQDLGQVNLFVGKNNCGKTTVLEAVALLATGGSLAALLDIVGRRGELITRPKDYSARTEYGIPFLFREYDEYDISHLFRGHRLERGTFFEIEGSNDGSATTRCEVVSALAPFNSVQTDMLKGDIDLGFPLGISLKGSGDAEPVRIPLSSLKGISREILRQIGTREREESKPVHFIPTGGLDSSAMGILWSQVALRPEEQHVVEALRIIDPDIDGIAFVAVESLRGGSATGMCVKLKSMDDRLPLGCMGGGIERLLALSLLVNRSKGCVLIDEIDTGFHFSVMNKMWEMVIRTANRLNVQVFATTHSHDCVRGLAELQQALPDLCEGVRVHRIEKDFEKAITYSAAEILIADEHHMEVR